MCFVISEISILRNGIHTMSNNGRWPSWLITCHESLISEDILDPQVKVFLEGVTAGIEYFYSHVDEGIEYIVENLGYTDQDTRDWLKTVKHVSNASKVDPSVIEKTVNILQKAGVVKGNHSLHSLVVPSSL